IEHLRGELAGAGAELDDPARAQGLEPAGALAGDAGAEEGRDLRGGNEVAVAPESPAAAGVVAQARLVERPGHEAVEADPASFLGDPRQQAKAQFLARLQGIGVGYGERVHPPIVESPG